MSKIWERFSIDLWSHSRMKGRSPAVASSSAGVNQQSDGLLFRCTNMSIRNEVLPGDDRPHFHVQRSHDLRGLALAPLQDVGRQVEQLGHFFGKHRGN